MSEALKKKRIWELDFIRGVAILGVIFVHLVFDLNNNFGIDFNLGPIFDAVQEYGSLIFIILSGVCVTLGKKSGMRGLVVIACGAIVTLVSYIMIDMKMLSPGLKIDFGILSCLGSCMILYIPFKKLSKFWLLGFGVFFAALGIAFDYIVMPNDWLFFLGLTSPHYSAGDFFPLFPNFGYFMLGAFAGKTLYKEKKSLIPKISDKTPVISWFCFCGRQSLWIYLVHQPLIYGIFYLIQFLRK